jgi:hypothetical protein
MKKWMRKLSVPPLLDVHPGRRFPCTPSPGCAREASRL